jgi:hypothetical protein
LIRFGQWAAFLFGEGPVSIVNRVAVIEQLKQTQDKGNKAIERKVILSYQIAQSLGFQWRLSRLGALAADSRVRIKQRSARTVRRLCVIFSMNAGDSRLPVVVWAPPDLSIRYVEHERRIALSRKGNTMKRLVHVIRLAICFAGLLTTSLFAQSSGGGSSSSGSGSSGSGTGTGTSGTSGSTTGTSGSTTGTSGSTTGTSGSTTGTSGSSTGTASGSTGTSKKDEDGSATEPQTRGTKEGSPSTSGSGTATSTGKSNKDEDGSATEPQTRGMKEGSSSTSGSGTATSTGKSNKDEDGSATEPQTRGMKEGSSSTK